MANFFFLSTNHEISIEHAKISVKFDNFSKGKARISFRTTLKPSENNNEMEFYLLINGDENPVKFEDFDEKYNEQLDTDQFIQAAGAYGLQQKAEITYCHTFLIDNFPEKPDIEGSRAIHPKKISCEQVKYKDIPKQLQGEINRRRDILLRIKVEDVDKIVSELPQIFNGDIFFIFQFRIFLRHFVPEETLKCWESPSKSWSVDFDIHKSRNYTELIEDFSNKEVLLTYPRSLELWFTIPHSHQFVASSPVYEKAFRLKSEDLSHKDVKQGPHEFETKEGDYAVKILNRSGSFVEFSIICISPFLTEKRVEAIEKDIKKFQAKASSFVTWRQMINPLVLLLALLTLVFAVIGVFIRQAEEVPKLGFSVWTIIIAAIFFGLSVWGITIAFYLFSKIVIKFEENMPVSPDRLVKYLTISITFVILALTFSFIFFYIRYFNN